MILAACSRWSWGTFAFWAPYVASGPYVHDRLFFLGTIFAAYAGTLYISGKIMMFPRCGRFVSVLTGAVSSFAAAALAIFIVRSYYSRSFFSFAFCMTLIWSYIGCRLFFSADNVLYGFTPGSAIRELKEAWRENFVTIPSPDSDIDFDILVVAPYMERPMPSEWMKYVTNMMIQGKQMAHPGTVYEFFTGRMPIEYMTEGSAAPFRPPRRYPLFKRMLDIFLAAVFAIPAAVLISLAAAGVLLTEGGPVFFVQERTGKNGKPFRMYKIRTMTDGKEITAVGRFLRKYRLDEIPQFLNVIKGEMSFIGPRPEVPELSLRYAEEIPFYPYRQSMLPGITGWAQVNYGYASVTSQNRIKLGYDLYYIKHASFALDCLILLKTARTMLVGFGER